MKGINITNRYNINFNQTEVQSHNTNILYSFGHLYEYGPLGGEDEKEFPDPKYIITKPKYKSLKEELTSNPFAVMNINQFNNELKKTTIHYKSKYWREYYQHWKKTTAFPEQWSNLPMETILCCLIALMTYCNFDAIQYEFSKTYRKITSEESVESMAKRHSYFYFLGKFVTFCVNTFGTEAPLYQSYYHGIGEQILFPTITSAFIYGPLSTTTTFEVAMHFAGATGLVIEFGAAKGTYELGKRFICNWLSEKMYFINVTHLGSGFELQEMMEVCRILQHLHASAALSVVETMEKKLMMKLIYNKLHSTNFDYPAFETLHPYAMKLFHQFCDSKKVLVIDKLLLNKYGFLSLWDLFVKQEAIQFEIIHALFPNLTKMLIQNICTDYVLSDLWNYLENNSSIELCII
eukprot:439864_1